jgi:peptidoglycan hydrolase-like protein with peptidoglycan-binding domain
MTSPRERQILTYLVVAVAVAVVAVATFRGSDSASEAVPIAAAAIDGADTDTDTTDGAAAGDPETSLPAADPGDPDSAGSGTEADLEADPDAVSCTMSVISLRQGESGESVACLQRALFDAGYLDAKPTGTFDGATNAAVQSMQADRDLFIDGVVGRESAISLGIWPDEQSFVVRTPPPPPGATDLMGFPLSSVSTSGPDAPPLPPNSGSGRRVVYERAGQRVWAVDQNERVIRSWLVSGSKYSNEMPGVHTVYSRSDVSTAWNGKALLPKMIRYQKTRLGNIGFHGIPLKVSDRSAYQTEAELGQRLSGGCQRQANPDADFMWSFAQVGTTIVVI